MGEQRRLTVWCSSCLPGRPCFVHEADGGYPPPAPDAPALDGLAEVLAAHHHKGGLSCSCGGFVADLSASTAWWDQHAAHVAAALAPTVARLVGEGRAEALREVTAAIEAVTGDPKSVFLSDSPNKVYRIAHREDRLAATVTRSYVLVDDVRKALDAARVVREGGPR